MRISGIEPSSVILVRTIYIILHNLERILRKVWVLFCNTWVYIKRILSNTSTML